MQHIPTPPTSWLPRQGEVIMAQDLELFLRPVGIQDCSIEIDNEVVKRSGQS